MKTNEALGCLAVAFGWLFTIATQTAAQDLGPHFKMLKEGIYVRAVKPADSNAAIILTSEGVVMIDSGHNPPDSVALSQAIKKLTPLPVRYLINTEPHSDHTTGHFVFSPPAIIVAHEGATESMKQAYNPKRNEKLMAEYPEMRESFKGFKIITPHIEYRHKMTLNVGERTFDLHYLKNVHSEADTAIWLPRERGAIFCGGGGNKARQQSPAIRADPRYDQRHEDDESAQSRDRRAGSRRAGDDEDLRRLDPVLQSPA